MASLTPTKLWLTDAKYLEDKRAVLLNFSQIDIRRNLLMPFFPSFYLSKKIVEEKQLHSLLSSFDKKSFKLEEEKTAFKVTGSSFSNLTGIANLLFQEMNLKPIVLEPERQFLLQKNWSYFDCFQFFSEKEFLKAECNELPAVKLPFFSEPLHETVQQLLAADQSTALKILESIALSNTLHLPLITLSPHNSMHAEAFFENIFWQKEKNKNTAKSSPLPQSKRPLPNIPNTTLFDFSQLWPTILTKPFYNISIETIGCNCCRPSSLSSGNVLPNTMVQVEFLQDAFYFDSIFPSFAQDFHRKNKAKENRLRRKKEFCLPSVPVGPFDRGHTAAIPLHDAITLSQRNKVKIISIQALHWFCLKRESAIAKKITAFQQKITEIEKKIQHTESASLNKLGLAAGQLLDNNLHLLFQKAKLRVYSNLIASIPGHLKNEESAFFSKELCSAFNCIESLILTNFSRFAQKQASKAVLLQKGNALVRSDKPMSLIKQFSAMQKIPALIKPAIRPKTSP